MSKNNFLLTLALALAAGVAGHALYGALASPQIAQARAASRDAGDVQWEYCAVLKAQYPNTVRFVYWIAYFKGEGVKTEDVESGPGGSAFAKAVAKLGQDGWEMVGAGPLEVRAESRPNPLNTPNAVFFKRRKD
ncbi:MAG: hypothetical protein DMF67_19475 [Acidobacteria bacterium]|nr:MAG: hypothetical protein DMF67_19475 [Acidobacteriota bacterium]